MGTGLKYVGSAVYVALLLVACGGDSDDSDDSDDSGGSDTGATSSTTGSTSGTTTSTTGGTATSSSSGGSSSSSTTASANTSSTGGSDPWVCLEVDSGCLCSQVPGSEGETGPCATTYDCCYGLEGSTCYCIETPSENCDELIELGYTRYESCPPP